MTEADELTIQRFAAICRGMDKGIERFEQMYHHLVAEVQNAHIRTMTGLMEGRHIRHPEAAIKAISKQLAHIEAGKPLSTLADIPRFLRITERVRF